MAAFVRRCWSGDIWICIELLLVTMPFSPIPYPFFFCRYSVHFTIDKSNSLLLSITGSTRSWKKHKRELSKRTFVSGWMGEKVEKNVRIRSWIGRKSAKEFTEKSASSVWCTIRPFGSTIALNWKNWQVICNSFVARVRVGIRTNCKQPWILPMVLFGLPPDSGTGWLNEV